MGFTPEAVEHFYHVWRQLGGDCSTFHFASLDEIRDIMRLIIVVAFGMFWADCNYAPRCWNNWERNKGKSLSGQFVKFIMTESFLLSDRCATVKRRV